MDYYILAVNPGSKSTRLAVYKNEELIIRDSINHPSEELNFFEDFYDQHNFRKMVIMDSLEKHNFDVKKLSCVVGRGGKLPPVSVGGYIVNDTMTEYLRNSTALPHVSNLGCMIAKDIADELGIPAYIYDAVSACTLPPEAKMTGIPEIKRIPYCHVLNSRSAAVKCAHSHGRRYRDSKIIAANLGTGISVSAHYMGKIIDVAGSYEGSISPERSGAVPANLLVELCFDGKFPKKAMEKKVRGEGGIKAYLGTSDMIEVVDMAKNGDEKAKLLLDTMFLQTAKAVSNMAAAMKGEVDEIILTGGMANSEYITDGIKKYISFIAPVYVYPGENELEALALGALRILTGEEEAHEFEI